MIVQAQALELPFKPFTFDEVKSITGVDTRVLEAWVGEGKMFPPRYGSGAVGLDYVQMFALFVGWRYLMEGAPKERATAVADMIASVSPEHVTKEVAAGNTFPVPAYLSPSGRPMFVKAPNSPLGRRLALDKLLGEFKDGIDRVFHTQKGDG